jgi:hypothetical protein
MLSKTPIQVAGLSAKDRKLNMVVQITRRKAGEKQS